MKHKSSQQAAFTLLEVLITLGILVTMVMFVSQLVKSGFDIRFALSDEARVTHRMSTVMQKINNDLTQAYLLSKERDSANERTYFQITKKGKSDRIAFTYMGHQRVYENAKESDQSFVVYEVRESKERPGRRDLYRGESSRVPESFKEDPPMHLFAENIESIRFEPWKGDAYSKDKWDSTQGDTKQKLPRMVKVQVKAWVEDEPVGSDGRTVGADDSLVLYSTIIYLVYSNDFNELKDHNASFRFDRI